MIFDKAPPDKAAAEPALTVTSVPAQVGGWYWTDERTVHYRPQQHWQTDTKSAPSDCSQSRKVEGALRFGV